MNAAAFALRRTDCFMHFLRRIDEREIPLTGEEIEKIERSLERTRPAFERPGVFRYEVVVKLAWGRICVIYDTHLRCLVNAWWRWGIPVPAAPRPAGKTGTAARDVKPGASWAFREHRTVAEAEV
jgi:hypothetical protein